MNSKAVRPNNRANPFNGRENLLTDPVFLLGNGKSRENFDLERLQSKGTIVGCNAIYRDFSPDILVAIDSKMLVELNTTTYCQENFCIIPHNRSSKVPNAQIWKSDRFNTSGCFAMRMIGSIMKPSKCYMLGMDCYPGNLYDNTKNYAVNTLQNFSGVGSFYMQALQASNTTIFVNVNTQDSWPKEAHKTGRYEYMTFEDFEKTVMAS